ncbi:MAG TPA: recombinase family protein [Acidobacteriota bacterium]|nr:recombinase family protein [Acidobacteriota bacterium]
MRAIIYARCSTNESMQSVELQLEVLRKYCEEKKWKYDEVSEYSSGFKGIPPKLRKVLDLIMRGNFDILVIHNIDRFSRLNPRSVQKILNRIIERGCRVIALQNNLDSKDEVMWNFFIGIWTTFANMYSEKLSERTRLGIDRMKKDIVNQGYYKSKKTGKKVKAIGRPQGSKDKKQRSKKGYYGRRYKFDL